MQVYQQMNADADNGLERIWAPNRDYIRRILIGMTRDIDLADDLLQETYLRARDGVANYRGDNDRAWLSTIARNLFLSHIRCRYVSAEINGDDTPDDCGHSPVGTQDHLELIRVRNAISELKPNLRTALLMKHYCGYTYREIAEHTNCPVGTAKWRVSLAVDRLKEMLGITEEQMELTCADISGRMDLDYLYGALTPDQKEAITQHIKNCPNCRKQIDGTRDILTALDALEGEVKHIQIIEMDPNGVLTLYTIMSEVNTSDTPQEVIKFCYNKGNAPQYMAAQGEELSLTIEDNPDTRYKNTDLCTAKLTKPVLPGEACSFMIIYPSWKSGLIEKQDDGTRKFRWNQLTSVDQDYAFAFALRLPPNARLVSANPSTTETRINPPNTTLVWQCMRAAGQPFDCEVIYELPSNAS